MTGKGKGVGRGESSQWGYSELSKLGSHLEEVLGEAGR